MMGVLWLARGALARGLQHVLRPGWTALVPARRNRALAWHDMARQGSQQCPPWPCCAAWQGSKAYLDFEFPEASILEEQEGQARKEEDTLMDDETPERGQLEVCEVVCQELQSEVGPAHTQASGQTKLASQELLSVFTQFAVSFPTPDGRRSTFSPPTGGGSTRALAPTAPAIPAQRWQDLLQQAESRSLIGVQLSIDPSS